MRSAGMISMAVAMVLLGACGSGDSVNGSGSSSATSPTTRSTKQLPHITIDAHDRGYVLPGQIPAGWVDVTLHNSGTVGHQIAFAKLNAVPFGLFKAAVALDNVKALSGVDFVGGPNNVDAGKSVSAVVHFDPGEYGVACFIPDDKDRKPHAAHGMVGEVQVASTAASVDDAPALDAGTITLSDFTFQPDASFTGDGLVQIKNTGTQIHELTIEREARGKTFADANRYLLPRAGTRAPTGPAPIADAGGVVAVGPGHTVYQSMALTPGRYVFVCFFPDPTRGGLRHAAEGMIKEITIS